MLSLPIEEVKATEKPAHLKVMYIYEDKARKFDFFLDAGRYTIQAIYDMVVEQASKERREVKTGKRQIVFADLRQST